VLLTARDLLSGADNLSATSGSNHNPASRGKGMDTRVGRRLSAARSASAELAEAAWLPLLTDLGFALPVKTARAIIALIPPASARSGRHGIDVSPMSGDWLQQRIADSGKRGDPP
jgi:hypothetical protein